MPPIIPGPPLGNKAVERNFASISQPKIPEANRPANQIATILIFSPRCWPACGVHAVLERAAPPRKWIDADWKHSIAPRITITEFQRRINGDRAPSPMITGDFEAGTEGGAACSYGG